MPIKRGGFRVLFARLMHCLFVDIVAMAIPVWLLLVLHLCFCTS